MLHQAISLLQNHQWLLISFHISAHKFFKITIPSSSLGLPVRGPNPITHIPPFYLKGKGAPPSPNLWSWSHPFWFLVQSCPFLITPICLFHPLISKNIQVPGTFPSLLNRTWKSYLTQLFNASINLCTTNDTVTTLHSFQWHPHIQFPTHYHFLIIFLNSGFGAQIYVFLRTSTHTMEYYIATKTTDKSNNINESHLLNVYQALWNYENAKMKEMISLLRLQL